MLKLAGLLGDGDVAYHATINVALQHLLLYLIAPASAIDKKRVGIK
jgi:hypothetical protein